MKNSFATFVLFANLFLAPANASVDVFAPTYPAKIVKIHVMTGQYVQMGQTLFTHEAMKMQGVVRASASGYLGDLSINLGDIVEPGLGGLGCIYQSNPNDPEPPVDGGNTGVDGLLNDPTDELEVVPDQVEGISAKAQQGPIISLVVYPVEENHSSSEINPIEPQPLVAEEISAQAESNSLEPAVEVAQTGSVTPQDVSSALSLVPEPLMPSAVEPQSPGVEEVVSPTEVSEIKVDGSCVLPKPYVPISRLVPQCPFQWMSRLLDLGFNRDLVQISKPTAASILMISVNQLIKLRLAPPANAHHKLWVRSIISSTIKTPFIEKVANHAHYTFKPRITDSEIEETLSRGGLRGEAMDSIMSVINSYAAYLLMKYALLWILLSSVAQMYLAQPHYAYLRRRYDFIVKRPIQATLVCDHL